VAYRDSTIIATTPFSSFVVPAPGMEVYMKIVISTNNVAALRCGRFAAFCDPDCPFSSFVVPAPGMEVY